MPEPNPDAIVESAQPEAPQGIPRWKKVVVTCAAFLVVSGVALRIAAALRDDDAPPQNEVVHSSRSTPFGSQSLVDGRGPTSSGDPRWVPGAPRDRSAPAPQAASDDITDYSPALLKGGLSFFVGFCIGFAVRTFLKISFVIAGVVLLAIFGLQYFGLVDVQWETIEGHFDSLVGKVGEQASDFKSFISGSLPSAGMAGLGLFTGVKRG